MILKNIVITICVLLLLFYFKYSVYNLFFNEGVNGTKIISPLVTGDLLLNGHQFLVLEKPLLYLGKKPKWKTCSELSKLFKNRIATFSQGKFIIGEVQILYEYIPEKIMKLYLRKKSGEIIYINTFADYGGGFNLNPDLVCESAKKTKGSLDLLAPIFFLSNSICRVVKNTITKRVDHYTAK